MWWKLEQRKLSDLKEYARNARQMTKHDADHLHESLNKFGQCEPIVINQDNTIIGGHQRARTMRQMGHTEVAVYVPSEPLNPSDVEELNIRLNRNNGDWDWDVLANSWDTNDLVAWGFLEKEVMMDKLTDPTDEPKEMSKSCSMTITFTDVDHLQEAENKIALIVDSYKGASYKIKV